MKHSYDKNTCLLEEQSQFFVKFNTIKRYRNWTALPNELKKRPDMFPSDWLTQWY